MPSSSALLSPAVTDAMPSATSWIAPVSSSAPTMTNRPMKKNSVGHSIPASAFSIDWRVTRSMIVAPASATVAGSRCSCLCTKNTGDRQQHDRQGPAQLVVVLDRASRIELHDRSRGLGGDLQPAAEHQVEQAA